MATTIRDIAKNAGVGVGTVSRVLNNNPAVSQQTRSRVLSVIKKFNYIPNANARRLSLGKTFNIAVIVPFFTMPSVVERLRGIEATLANSEYDLVLYNVESVERRNFCFLHVPRVQRIDGMLIISLSPHHVDVTHFLQSHVPTVLIDARHDKLNRIVIDDVLGGQQATEYLLSLGHKRIAFVGDVLQNPFNFCSISDRFEGYKKALAQAGIGFRPEYHMQSAHGRAQSHQMALNLLTLPTPPTAIFAASDTQAFGVLQAAKQLGIHVPHELSVIGYDDIELAPYFDLTTIRQPLFETGRYGAELLLRTIKNKPSTPIKTLLPTELVVRQTTAPLHQN